MLHPGVGVAGDFEIFKIPAAAAGTKIQNSDRTSTCSNSSIDCRSRNVSSLCDCFVVLLLLIGRRTVLSLISK